MAQQPWIFIISGPNGAGKSTFYKYVLSRNPFLSNSVFLNYDDTFKRFKELPEYSARYEQIKSDMTYQINTANTNVATIFKKQMEQIGGNLNERITQPIENKEYWHAQYLIFTHIPTGWEHIKENLNSTKDLARKLGGDTIHDRINAKSENNNWYINYKKLVHNLEIQKTIIINSAKQKTDALNAEIRRQTLKTLRTNINISFATSKNIIFETTGAGIPQIQKQARKYNYHIYGSHICVFHPEISVARVQHRVENGGHDVPYDVILQRFETHSKKLLDIIQQEDTAIVIDNSNKKPFNPVFMLSNKHLINFTICPEYLTNIHQQIKQVYSEQSIQELLQLQHHIDIKKLSEKQRENFGQIILTNLLKPNTTQHTRHNWLERIKTFLYNTHIKRK